MSEKKFHKNLILLRNKINFSSEIENQEIDYILKWLKQKNFENKMNVKKIRVNQLKDWKKDYHGGIYHKSKQFYLKREVTYKNLLTIFRQLLNSLCIPYTSKIIYNKSKYCIHYIIILNPRKII